GRRSNRFAFVLGASTGLLALFFHSVVDFNMHIPANAILAVALMAMLSSHLRFTTERYWSSLGAGKKALASAVLLAGLLYLGQQEAQSVELLQLSGPGLVFGLAGSQGGSGPLFRPRRTTRSERLFHDGQYRPALCRTGKLCRGQIMVRALHPPAMEGQYNRSG